MDPKFDLYPFIEVNGIQKCYCGWDEISLKIREETEILKKSKKIVVIECYHGVLYDEITGGLENLGSVMIINAEQAMHEESYIEKLVYPDVTDDRLFGHMTRLNVDDYYCSDKIKNLRSKINNIKSGLIIIYGVGASIVYGNPDLLIYADMSRWEIQSRLRAHKINSIGLKNKDSSDWMLLYKQGYFVDWRVCDRLKKKLFKKINFLLDTNRENNPLMVNYSAVIQGLRQATERPFSLVPYFDSGPWGGQWMKEICGLDRNVSNYAWCFNCVPEENSLLLKIDGQLVEIPSINLVFMYPEELLGTDVYDRFGDEFPIRFDYLDTMGGGNLSLQVHPLTEYIKEKFGMSYTQDESYYLIDAGKGAEVYLGFKENIDKDKFIRNLYEAQTGGNSFDADRYIEKWKTARHDHFLIPAGTVHCSGKDCMVLEISATPYIFTFKLWDWDRMGLDGKPRQINIEHGKNVIQWNRTTEWTKRELVNRIELINEGDGWREERTGLHESEFIETRRHWFTKKVLHNTNGGVNVLCLVEGTKVIVESPGGKFKPFVVNYAETFIVPASVENYTIRPFDMSDNNTHVTIKAFVRI